MNATGQAQGLKGTGYKQVTTQNFTPEQMQLFQKMFEQISPQSYTSRLASGDQGIFNEIEAPALQQFAGLQGNIASRFSGMGTGARRSSGFQNVANTAAQDFASQLQAQRMSLQRQAQQDLFGMQESLLGQRPFETTLVPKQQKSSFWEQLLGALSGGIGQGAGQLGSLYGGKKLGLF